MAERDDLQRQIFGGSDSELSDDEEEALQQQQQPRNRSLPRQPRDDYESSGADSEDEYVQERHTSKPKKRSKIRKSTGEDGRPVQRKRKRKQPAEPVDLSELPPEQANKIRLDMQIEAILKPKKARPRKRKAGEEVLDSYADDEVARLREAMNNAADEDIKANSEKLPATAKLKMLPEAMETLRKASLAQSMIDNNLLEAVKRWLEPLPDRSLPALNIQREFFTIVRKMEFIDSAVLKESGLGRVVLFYTKCKRVTPDITKIANELVSTWSRPIIKRSASYRDRIIPIAQEHEGADGAAMRGDKFNAIMAKVKADDKNRVRKNAVAIPRSELGNYTVAPKMNAGVMRNNVSVDADIERRRKNAERMRSLTRKVSMKA